jgi:hypothetical protein
MKFRAPRTVAAPIDDEGGYGRSRGRPEWLDKWIEEQGNWRELSCGDIDNINDKTLRAIHNFGKRTTHVECWKCGAYALVGKPSSVSAYMQKYHGFPPPPPPSDEPLF